MWEGKVDGRGGRGGRKPWEACNFEKVMSDESEDEEEGASDEDDDDDDEEEEEM